MTTPPPTAPGTTEPTAPIGAGRSAEFTFTTKRGHTLTIDPKQFDPSAEAIINFGKANRDPNSTELDRTSALLDFMCSALDDKQGAILKAMRGSEVSELLAAWGEHTGAPMGKSLTS